MHKHMTIKKWYLLPLFYFHKYRTTRLTSMYCYIAKFVYQITTRNVAVHIHFNVVPTLLKSVVTFVTIVCLTAEILLYEVFYNINLVKNRIYLKCYSVSKKKNYNSLDLKLDKSAYLLKFHHYTIHMYA